MTQSHSKFACVLLTLCLSGAIQLHAQFPGGGPGGGATTSRSQTSTRQYPNNGVGGATITVDQQTHNLIVSADQDTINYISQVVSNLARPKPQVLIKVVFLEVTHNDSLDIGIDGSFNKNIGNSLTSGFVTNFTLLNGGTTNATIVPKSIMPVFSSLTGSNMFGLASAGSPAGLYQLFAQDYQVTLRAIAQAGKARVLSRPSIIARNNQPATITVGQSVPLITGVNYDSFGNARNSISYTSIGIILRVTPFITPDGLVEMILAPETSELVADRSQWVPISSGPGGSVSAPLINTRSADTVVITPDGQTVVIGGLIENSKAEAVTKIPWLGDIPWLGQLFRHTIKNDARTELLIFLTPHIVQAPTEMAALSDKERERSDAVKANEKELNKFLDTLPTRPEPAPEPPKKKSSSRNGK